MSRIGRFLVRLIRAFLNVILLSIRAVLYSFHGLVILALLATAVAAVVALANFQWHFVRAVTFPATSVLNVTIPATTISFVSQNEGIPPRVWAAATLIFLVASLYAFVVEKLRRSKSTPAPLYFGILSILMLQLGLLFTAESVYDYLWKTFK